ncbi:hypothetical protein EXIGLDRAFT_675323, partial [Exidia glandulosa HHB12029]
MLLIANSEPLPQIQPRKRVYCETQSIPAPFYAHVSAAWLGNDFPEEFPMHPFAKVKLTVEDSTHLQILDDAATHDWSRGFPSSGGYVYLGPHRRKFALSMFHSMHCLGQLQSVLSGTGNPIERPSSHVQHCMNYLRLLIMCQPDLTLEPMSRHVHDERHVNGVDGLGVTHTCRDWSQVYSSVELNWDDYQAWLNR